MSTNPGQTLPPEAAFKLLPADLKKWMAAQLKRVIGRKLPSLMAVDPFAYLNRPDKVMEALRKRTNRLAWKFIERDLQALGEQAHCLFEQAQKTAKERRACVISWVNEQLLPALEILTRTAFGDYAPLTNAETIQGLPTQLQSNWPRVVERGQECVRAIMAADASWGTDDGRYCLALFVDHINKAFLAPFHLHLAQCAHRPRGAAGNFPFDRRELMLGRVVQRFPFFFQGRQIEAITLRATATDLMSRMTAFADPRLDHVTVWLDALEQDIRLELELANGNEAARDFLRTAGCTELDLQAQAEFGKWALARYGTYNEYVNRCFNRVVMEETRHIVDHMRLRGTSTARGIYEEFLTPLLRDKTEVYRHFYQSLACQELNVDETLYWTSVIIELSGQLVAATGPDPALVLREWLRSFQQRPTYQGNMFKHTQHDFAEELAVILLGQECGLVGRANLCATRHGPIKAIWRIARMFDNELAPTIHFASHPRPVLRSCLENLQRRAEKDPKGMRLMIKRVYGQVFQGAVDEPPFYTIDADGGRSENRYFEDFKLSVNVNGA